MAALWIHDLRNESSVANPETVLDHPLELMMEGANHGGLWRVAYLARTALPFAAIYGFAAEKLPVKKFSKNNEVKSPILKLGFLQLFVLTMC